MSKVLVFATRHRLGKLHTELLAAIPALRPVPVPGDEFPVAVMSISGDGETVTLAVPDDVDEPAIQAVVDAHDASTPGPYETQQVAAAANEATLQQRADQAVATLEQAWSNWGSLTAAQKDAALKLNVRVTVALARLTLRKLDSA